MINKIDGGHNYQFLGIRQACLDARNKNVEIKFVPMIRNGLASFGKV